MDGVRRAKSLERPARDVPEKSLDAVLSGPEAVAPVAGWPALLRDERYELTLPYSDDREQVLDILRHVPVVQVLAPPS